MKYAIVQEQPRSKYNYEFTRWVEIALSDSKEALEKVIETNNLVDVRIIER